MFRALIDTCVWLDLAKDVQPEPLPTILEGLINKGKIELIVPRTVVTEFDRHKDRMAKESAQSLSSVFKRVKDAVDKCGDPRTAAKLQQLNDVSPGFSRVRPREKRPKGVPRQAGGSEC